MSNDFPSYAVGNFGVVPQHHRFNYDATEPKGRRKSPSPSSHAEDSILTSEKRAKLTANSRDLHRNYSIMAWMIRCHLNYVTAFNFHAQTSDEGFNTELEAIVDEQSKAENCDVRGRHSLPEITRLSELRSLVDGDLGLVRLKSLHLQGIEGDRIRDPNVKDDSWVQGVQTDSLGKPIKYSIHKRTKNGLKPERIISADNLYMLGHYERFDQTRGITPISAALNSLRDVYENIEQALLKAKVHNSFGMKIIRASGGEEAFEETDEETGRTTYKVDFGAGPFLLDLDPGDDADFLMSNHPSNEFQDFMRVVTMITLRALDLPYSFFDESHTNFFGSRGAWLHYERSCEPKRKRVASMLDWVTRWWIMSKIANKQIILPRTMDISDILWEYVPVGMPWWKPSEEINGDVMAIRAGLTSPQRVVRQRGTGEFYDNVREIAKAQNYARDNGVQLAFDPQPIINVNTNNDDQQQ